VKEQCLDAILPLGLEEANTADGWMRDITADIARELRFRGAGGRVWRARPFTFPMH
jgi:hypothetical protein